MAEAILNKMGAGRFRAFSAGSHPKSSPNPFALGKRRFIHNLCQRQA
jgi:protein-tyrosine-phosphatase